MKTTLKLSLIALSTTFALAACSQNTPSNEQTASGTQGNPSAVGNLNQQASYIFGMQAGASLKEIREYKNVSIERMAEMTKVSKSHLIGIENDDPSKLPADVYVRGYVFQYAKVLKLNPDLVAQSYMLHFKKLRASK